LLCHPLWRSVLNLSLHGRKLSAAILLVALALCALFLAKGTTSLIAGMLLPPQPTLAGASGAGAVARAPGSEMPDFKAILKRNIFDPTTGPLWPPKPPPTDTPKEGQQAVQESPEQLAPGQLPPPCEGASKMISSVYSELHPEWSFATLTTGSDTPLLYREGSRLEDKQIVTILPKAVFLRQANGRLCSLVLFVDKAALQARAQKNAAAEAAPSTAAPMAAATLGGISEAEMDQNIHASSETKFGVPRTFVDKILSNQAEIMSSARVVPHEENGQVVGVKLYGIRRNSLLGKLGLQNGDMLRTINGFAMSSPDTALEAYSRLRTASNLAVAIERRGQAMNIQYDIQ
jgi:general secretion pathway protein C